MPFILGFVLIRFEITFWSMTVKGRIETESSVPLRNQRDFANAPLDHRRNSATALQGLVECLHISEPLCADCMVVISFRYINTRLGHLDECIIEDWLRSRCYLGCLLGLHQRTGRRVDRLKVPDCGLVKMRHAISEAFLCNFLGNLGAKVCMAFVLARFLALLVPEVLNLLF